MYLQLMPLLHLNCLRYLQLQFLHLSMEVYQPCQLKSNIVTYLLITICNDKIVHSLKQHIGMFLTHKMNNAIPRNCFVLFDPKFIEGARSTCFFVEFSTRLSCKHFTNDKL
jgi:hypothetical protein